MKLVFLFVFFKKLEIAIKLLGKKKVKKDIKFLERA